MTFILMHCISSFCFKIVYFPPITAVTPQIEESIRDPEVLEIPEKDLLPEDVCPQSVAPEVTEERPSGIEEVENKEVECPEDTCNTAIPQTRPTCSSSPETSKEQIDIGDSLCDSKLHGILATTI